MKKWPIALAAGMFLFAESASAAEVGEITWRGLVPGDRILNMSDPKAGIDEMVKYGYNVMYRFETTKDFCVSSNWPRVREIYQYARTKGVRVLIVAPTAIWHRNNRPKSVSYNDWPCVKNTKGWTDHLYCWGDDRQTEEVANRCADHLIGESAEDAIVMIHPVDTGGLKDPELWSKRCARCRARWKDDERWKATVNQLNIWNRVLKRRCPKAIVGSCIYPYKLQHLVSEHDANWQQNFYDFWRHVDEGVKDDSFFFGSWNYSDAVASSGEVRKLVKRRPLQIHDLYPVVCGVFSTHGRRAALTMDKQPGNIFCSYMDCPSMSWETYIFQAAYLKRQTLPGSVAYDGMVYYDPTADHDSPSECRPVLAMVCRKFWGEKIAGDMEDFCWSGVMPRYIETPGEMVRQWNRARKYTQYDPTGGAGNDVSRTSYTEIVDDTAFMRDQAKKAEVAAAAIDRALAKLGLGPKSTANEWAARMPKVVQRDCLRMRARDCRYWLAAAHAQVGLRTFDDQFRAGDPAAAATLTAAERRFADDYAVAEAWGSPGRRDWKLPRETLEREFAKGRLLLDLSARPDAARAAEMKTRAWALPANPQPLVDYPVDGKATVTWEGDVVVDRQIDLASHRLRVLPGTKVLFKGEGRINLQKGALTAWGATFEADSALTNAFRVSIDGGTMHLNGCTFRNIRTHRSANWSRGMMHAGVKDESRVENCLFENCSPVVLMLSRRATFANNRVVGGDGGVFVSSAHQMSVIGNRFENIRGRAVDLQGGDGVIVADNVFIACEEGVGGYEGVGGWKPGVGNYILGNAFFGLANPVRFNKNPFLSGVIAGNWFDGCAAINVLEDAKRPHRAYNNVFVK